MLAGAARAEVVSYATSTGPTQQATNWSTTLNLPAFDASLGTLTAVKFSYKGDVLHTIFAENLNALPSSYDLLSQVNLQLTHEGGLTLFAPAPLVFNATGNQAAFDGLLDFDGASGDTLLHEGTWSDDYFASSLLPYIGSTPLSFAATAVSSFSNEGGGNFATGGEATAGASLTVEYTFTPIPEPSTYAALLGGAALGFAALRRRQAAAV